MKTTRTLKVTCKDDGFYKFLRKEQREQNKALNLGIGYIHTSKILRGNDSASETKMQNSIIKLESKISKLENDLSKPKIKDEKKQQILKAIQTNKDIIEDNKNILEESKLYRTGLDNKFNELYMDKTNLYHVLKSSTSIQYARTLELVRKKVQEDHNNNFTDIMTGKISLMNYKQDNPLMIDGACIKISKEESDYKIGIMLGYELDIELGRRNNENLNELKRTLDKCISGEYKMCQSRITFDKNNNVKFSLVLDIPKTNTYQSIKGRVLGVDLGIVVPAYMCISDDTYKRKALGNINNFLRVREQMQDRRRQFQKDITLTNGGKGRKKKTQLLEKLKQNESNFCRTYNHKISKEIVLFAKRNKCEYIHLEKLTKEGFPDSVLRNWSYYQLQTMVKYKAEREGIEVKYIDPAYTSQTCSRCGNIDKDNRPKKDKGQAYFKCTKCDFELNADHNAAINIARSQKFLK